MRNQINLFLHLLFIWVQDFFLHVALNHRHFFGQKGKGSSRVVNKTAVVHLGAAGGPNETFHGAKPSVRAED